MTARRAQCHFWPQRQKFFFSFRSSAERKERSYQSPRHAPAMVTLRTGFEVCLNWLLLFGPSAETLLSSHRTICKKSLQETRSEVSNKRIQVRKVLLHQCWENRDPARPLAWLFWKSVRTPVISAPQQTEMTAADSGCYSVFKPAVRTWLV